MFAQINLRHVLTVMVGLLIGLALAYALVLPRVEMSAPGAADASTSATVELRFSRAVQPASVERRFTIEPPVDGSFVWLDPQTVRFQPAAPLEPDATYHVQLAPGVRTARGVIRPWGARFAFTTGQATVLYLAEDPANEGQINLWRVEPDGNTPRQLTELELEQSVYSYAASPDGGRIVLSLENADGGADLALLDRTGGQPELIRACPGAACIHPVWSPDGSRVAFEQRAVVVSDIGPSWLTGQVWVLDVATGEAQPVVEREVGQGIRPRWSPDGTRLAFYEGNLQAIAIYDVAADEMRLVPNLAGERIAWAPDGASIAFAEIFLSEEDADLLAAHAHEHDPTEPHEEPTPSATYLHLVRFDFETGVLSDLSGVLAVEDGTPVFSPDGRWLAFGHRQLEGKETTFGRQLWLYDLENDERLSLLDEPTYNHGAFSWSPDSSTIVYMRFDLLNPGAFADIWLVDVTSGEAHPVVEGGFSPTWLP